LQQLEADIDGGMEEEMQKLQDQALRIFLLYLVDITFFTDKSATYVDVVYLKYFRDMEVVSGYSWGPGALSHLYRELNRVSNWNIKHLSGYLTLLQV